jgi:hypothetical protein
MSLEDRSDFLLEVFRKYIPKNATILEIGHGDGRNLRRLFLDGYQFTFGIDKESGEAIEDVAEDTYDVIFTMSCLFLIPETNEWVFEKIAKMAKKWLITIEGETTKGNGVIGRDYSKIFIPLGFDEVEHQTDVFNRYGHLRVFKKHGTA